MAIDFKGVTKFKNLKLSGRSITGSQPGEDAAYIIDGYGFNLGKYFSAGKYSFGTSYRLYALEINADTGGVDMAGDVNAGAIKGRTVIGTTQTNLGASGITGTLDIASGKNLVANYQGICGVLDFYGNTTISGSDSHAAALVGVVWNEGTTTLNASATSSVSGIELVQNIYGVTETAGINPAIYIRASSSTAAWQYGVYMQASHFTTGMYIGACTTGISMVGTINTAIDLQSVVAGTNAGGDQATLIRAGTAGAKMLFATNYQQGCLFHLKTAGGRFTGLEMNAYTEYEGDNPGADKGLRGIECIARSLVNDAGGAPDMYSICGSVQILASRDAPIAGSKIVAGYFSYSVDATAASYAGYATCLYLETGSGRQMAQGDYMVYMISNNAAAKPLTSFLACYGGASAILQLGPEMTPANGQAWDTSGGISAGTTAGGWLKISAWTGAAFEDRFINLVTGA